MTTQGNHKSDELYAAIDLGTNNCRLLIARPELQKDGHGSTLKIVDSYSRVVKLGSGVSDTGQLGEEAIDRTLAALEQCKRKIDRHNVCNSRFVATEACRKSSNADHFIGRVRREIGLEIDIITPEEEAELALLGCYSLINAKAKQTLAFDIGGGSTEVMLVDLEHHINNSSPFPFRPHIRDWVSIPYGVMNLSEKMGGNPGYTELYFEDIVSRLSESLSNFAKRHPITPSQLADKTVQFLSTSGTATTLAAVHKDLPRYERNKIDGLNLPLSAISDSTQKLLNMRPSERFAHPCIGADRNDYILAGCAIFEAIARTWAFAEITVADRGVREGIIVAQMLDEHHGKKQPQKQLLKQSKEVSHG